jgi:hypothetical protein
MRAAQTGRETENGCYIPAPPTPFRQRATSRLHDPAGENHMPTIFGSRALGIGIALLVIGTGPLLANVAYLELWQGDRNPNPIGTGMLAMVTFWPSIILIVIGIMGVVRSRKK